MSRELKLVLVLIACLLVLLYWLHTLHKMNADAE